MSFEEVFLSDSGNLFVYVIRNLSTNELLKLTSCSKKLRNTLYSRPATTLLGKYIDFVLREVVGYHIPMCKQINGNCVKVKYVIVETHSIMVNPCPKCKYMILDSINDPRINIDVGKIMGFSVIKDRPYDFIVKSVVFNAFNS